MSRIQQVAVIGAGNMGSGIAQKLAQEGVPVVMVDTKEEFLNRGLSMIDNMLKEAVDRKILVEKQVKEIRERIHTTTDLNAVADADLVIEAVYEDKAVKRELFKKLDAICSDKTILATNTSSFSVREFAKETRRPDRFIGLHYFYHPAKNRLLEVIPHDDTSASTLQTSLLAAKLHGKTAIVVKDSPGFAVNRFFVPFLNEATRMLEEGAANIPTIEEAAKRAFKIGMGPFELMNVTGLPIALHSATTLGNELGPFYAPSQILKTQVEKGENWNLKGEVDTSKLDSIMNRFYGVCLGVAAAAADEKVARKEDIDRGAKIGLRWALGPFEIMNKIGIEKTFEVVQALCWRYPDFKMPQILLRQKALGKPFTFSFVDLEVKKDVAYITLNRPEAMNALNEQVVNQLGERFGEAEENPEVRAIVFRGAGKAFVGGADVRYFVEKIKLNQIQDIVDFTRKGHGLLLRVENSDKLTIALLDGLSLGGGSELALACQAIIATAAGSMAFPETGIGIYPGLGGMFRLASQVGVDLAKYYILTGATLGAADLKELGIVKKLVEPHEVESTVRALLFEDKPEKYRLRNIPERFKPLQELFKGRHTDMFLRGELPESVDPALGERTLKYLGYKAPLALRVANEIMDAQAGKPIADAIEIELDRLSEIFKTADALEGLSSVGRKRPQFKGA
ncbi:MAG: 3-hydroxyacyl-CoA dehydrogenase/enoyl-CoA hydratase family protein [Deltaproteobacteria bacterium]|nr:3-hydroxyacyl-CoA dehydrogenase/enoyl-CoA hydratase family protein [Deltaproteobacteria bacterium]